MSDRPELGVLLYPLYRRVLAFEAPIFEAHDLGMWAYIVLSRLVTGPVRGQSVLAEAIGADKTRIIEVLDDLQDRGLISREPDPADRRARLLGATAKGRRLYAQVHRAIRQEEDALLAELPAPDRAAFVRALRRLYAERLD